LHIPETRNGIYNRQSQKRRERGELVLRVIPVNGPEHYLCLSVHDIRALKDKLNEGIVYMAQLEEEAEGKDALGVCCANPNQVYRDGIVCLNCGKREREVY
jgi:hypothetical protein